MRGRCLWYLAVAEPNKRGKIGFMYKILSPILNTSAAFLCAFWVLTGSICAEETWYTVGPGDVLQISVLQPEEIQSQVTVTMDGAVSFPFIGNVKVRGMTLAEIQQTIQQRLADGYFQYPVVSVAMQESNSKHYFVYGEVNTPGGYPMTENMSILRAISVAGGFTKFGSTSVKILRPREGSSGYEPILVDVRDVMRGTSAGDIAVKSGDVIVVAEGRF